LCCTLVIWLHLRAGVSRATSNIILRSLKIILATSFTIVSLAFQAAMGVKLPLSSPEIPVDVRTALKLRLIEPVILRTICCPKCFWVYGNTAPEKCTWRESRRSRPCAADLWTTRNTSQGPKRVPKSLYTTQCFDDWLRFFLGRQIIEDALIKSFELFRNSAGNHEYMHDVHESPAWRTFHGPFSNAYNLVFGVYIDWFNPLTNRIAGKKISYGAIVLYCMNLPPEMRFRPENVYIAGITPGPNAPNMITISHILALLMNALSRYTTPPGHHVPTFRHPLGMLIQLALAPLIADIEAVRKAAGFMSHSATLFCSFCDLPSHRIEELNSSSWTRRTAEQVRAQAEHWRSLTTKKARKEQATSTGVRWTPFYLLHAWNPVDHVMLGYMHNWLEGVLKHQLRRLWNLGPVKENAADMPDPETAAADASDIESDASSSSSTASLRPTSDAEMPPPSSTPSGDSTPRASHFTLPLDHLGDDSDSDSDDDVEINVDFEAAPTSSNAPFHFTDMQLSIVRGAIGLVTLPTHIDRPPTNLGQAKHGKLKADTYLTLFAFIFPLIIPELWWTFPPSSYERELLNSFYHLIVATYVIISYVSSTYDQGLFGYHYISYRRSIQQLFPVGSLPNHHYAMHYPDIMRNWGPVASLNEFAGERLNGQLQRTKTNRHMRDMDYTMLHQATRRARLQAMLRDTVPDDSASSRLSAILGEVDSDTSATGSSAHTDNLLSSEELSKFLAAAPLLDARYYSLILQYVQMHIRLFQSFETLPAHPNIPILPPNAKQLRTFSIHDRSYSDRVQHEGNSAIQFRDPRDSSTKTGFIHFVCTLPLERQLRTFVLVNPHNPLPEQEFLLTPYSHYTLLKTQIFDATPSLDLIVLEPTDILSHVTTLRRPVGTYGI
ncbi:hypothetical protein PENSPDRAFT_543852, partial [Peniophora sp. CONT]